MLKYTLIVVSWKDEDDDTFQAAFAEEEFAYDLTKQLAKAGYAFKSEQVHREDYIFQNGKRRK
jgi:hypothetical protein